MVTVSLYSNSTPKTVCTTLGFIPIFWSCSWIKLFLRSFSSVLSVLECSGLPVVEALGSGGDIGLFILFAFKEWIGHCLLQ